MVLGNLDQGLGQADDEGVGLALGLVVVIAKDRLEALRPDQIGERGNCFAILSQDGSRQAQMFALLTKRGGGKRALGCLGPLVEEIGIGTKRKIGVRVLLEARAQVRPLQMLGRRLEGEGGQLGGRPGIELCAGLVPDIGNAAHEVAWLRVERLGLQPSQESLDDRVVHLARRDALTGAPICEGGEPVRQALVISDGFEQRSPYRVASGATPARGDR